MASVLISLIGKGRNDPNSPSRAGYQTATYQFDDGQTHATSFFGLAAWNYLRGQNPPTDRWVIMGTPASAWASLADVVDLPDQDEALGHLLSWSDRLRALADRNAVTQADLAAFPHIQSGQPLADHLTLVLLPDGETRADHAQLVTTLINHLHPGDRLTFDITHGYRHLPVLLTFAATSLRFLMDITVERVLYGKFEGAFKDDRGESITPVVDLTLCAEMAEQAAAFTTFHLTGHHEALAPMFPGAQDSLRRLSFFESINFVTDAKKLANDVTKVLHDRQPERTHDAPLLESIAQELAKATRWATQGKLPQRMLERARFLRAHGQNLAAVMLYFEAVQKQGEALISKAELEATDFKERGKLRFAQAQRSMSKSVKDGLKDLRDLRNLLFHVARPSKKDLQQAMHDPAAFDALLDHIDAAVEAVVGGTS